MRVNITVPGWFQPAYLWAAYLDKHHALNRIVTPLPHARVADFGVGRHHMTSVSSIGLINYVARRVRFRFVESATRRLSAGALDRRAASLLAGSTVFNGWTTCSL